jgi:hypothetical protein
MSRHIYEYVFDSISRWCQAKSAHIFVYTAKNQCRKFETIILRKGIAQPQSQFAHSSVCERDLYIPTIDLSILLQEICEPILIDHRHMNVEIETEAAHSHKRNTRMGFSLQCIP